MKKNRQHFIQHVLALLTYYSFKILRFLSNRLKNFQQFISGFSLAALNNEGRSVLTAVIYNSKKKLERDTLFNWEIQWFENDLPKSPARILVGGAGTGREVNALIKMGYSVVAFDPVAGCVKKAKQKITSQENLSYETGSYEDLSEERTDNLSFRKTIQSYMPYDAIILGWGSFTHICDEKSRIGLLNKAAMLCPKGPVLLSFWLESHSIGMERSPVWSLGYKAAQFMGFGRSLKKTLPKRDDITMHAGYGHFFTIPEIEDIVKTGRYRIYKNPKVSYMNSYPHITIKPDHSSDNDV